MGEKVQIQKGKVKAPFNILLHGEPGVGKSYFASQLPSPIFIGAEEQDELDAHKMPKINSWQELSGQLNWLLNKKHDYKTIVIDTIDSLETLLHKHILETDPKKTGSMAKAHGGYGAAFGMALNEMTHLRDTLSMLKQRGLNICIICHTISKRVSDPTALAEYDEHKLVLHDKTESLFVDWVSAVLFMKLKVEKQDDERFAFGDGKKVLMCEKRPGFLAKNRYQLPAQLDVVFDQPAKTFLQALDRFYDGKKRNVDELKQNIVALAAQIKDDDLKEKVLETVKKQSAVNALEKTEKRVKELLNA